MVNRWATKEEESRVRAGTSNQLGCPSDLFWKETVMDRANANSLVSRRLWEMSPDNTWWFCRSLFTASIYWLVSKARFWYLSNNCRVPGIPYLSFSILVFPYTFYFFLSEHCFSPRTVFFMWKWNLDIENLRSRIKAMIIGIAVEVNFDLLSYSSIWATVL